MISFEISGAFAAFRDPSVTSNQTVYHIPSKSAVIGILGAMIGITRPDNLGELYSSGYKDFFKKTKIGLRFESEPKKVTMFTNHRSLKEHKTKPFKTELVENPRYTVYVITEEDSLNKLSDALENNRFVFSPYLGHAYCPATISNYAQFEAIPTEPVGEETQCVILDESETYNKDFEFKLEMSGSLIIERHIHHFFDNERFDGRVLKHWIPTHNSELEILSDSQRNISQFYKVGDYVICMY